MDRKKLFIFILIILINFSIAQNSIDNSVTANQDINTTTNQTNLENLSEIKHPEIDIIKFFPKEVKLGDVQFNIQIKNNKNESLRNVLAFISGKGFSTYEIIPIDNLESNERDYIFVSGNFKESGDINLTIRIEDEVFYQKISVIDINEGVKKTQEQLNLDKLNNLTKALEIMKKNYTDLELEIFEKKEEEYDVSDINLDELKKLIRSVEVDILRKDIIQSEINIRLAQEEFDYQKKKVDNVKIIPLLNRIKDKALILSAIFGSILAFFALSELFKRKSGEIVVGVKKFVVKKNKKRKTRV